MSAPIARSFKPFLRLVTLARGRGRSEPAPSVVVPCALRGVGLGSLFLPREEGNG
jgi:hypothetical protein